MKKKVFSLLLAGMLTFSMGTTAYATEDAIADSYTKVKIVFGRNDYLTLQNCNVK